MMAVYAAMVDRLDQNIGRLVAYLDKNNQLDNTLILFFSDNGACPYQRLRTDLKRPGPKESDIAYDARWANMCNTPLRLYKQYAHEGGTSTPMIAHWPNQIKAHGEISRYTGHLVDLMPTAIELAGATYPIERRGQKIRPLEGVSLTSAFQGKEQRDHNHPLFWEYSGNHAIRSGDWKLVAERSKEWELYDLAADRSETVNLASALPERVEALAQVYDQWADRAGARSHAKCVATKPSTQEQLFELP
jgi:arylsulfatase